MSNYLYHICFYYPDGTYHYATCFTSSSGCHLFAKQEWLWVPKTEHFIYYLIHRCSFGSEPCNDPNTVTSYFAYNFCTGERLKFNKPYIIEGFYEKTV